MITNRTGIQTQIRTKLIRAEVLRLSTEVGTYKTIPAQTDGRCPSCGVRSPHGKCGVCGAEVWEVVYDKRG